MMKFVATHDGQTVEYHLKEGVNTVGRDKNCDVAIDHPQVSRRHVSVAVGPEGAVIQDLNSRNGTFVNGLRVKDTAQLKHGDTVALGKYLMKFMAEKPGDIAKEVPPAPLTVEPQREADTLPFKGKYAKMMGGEAGAMLPTKFDPSRYQVEVDGQRIIVTDAETRQAMELYRGTPDAAILERLMDERRRRERRNLILGIAGGIVGLALLALVAMAVLSPPPKKTQPKFDAAAYYAELNRAVDAFDSGASLDAVNAFLQKADKIVAPRTYPTHHVQMKNIFWLRRELDANPADGKKWEQIIGYIRKIKEEGFPDEVDAGRVNDFTAKLADVAKKEKGNWELLRTAEEKRGKFRETEDEDAFGRLREIDSKSVYYNEAQRAIKTLAQEIADKYIKREVGVTLDKLMNVTEQNLDMRTVDAWISMADKLLENAYFRNNEDRNTIRNFKDLCETFRKKEENKQEAVRLAREHLARGEAVEAWNKVKYLEDDPDEARRIFVREVKKEYDAAGALAAVREAYKIGRGEEALQLIAKYREEGLSADEWLILQNRISIIIALYSEARAAEEIGDVLTAKTKYENIASQEDSEANHYRQQADAFLAKYKETPKDAFARAYVAQGLKMAEDGNYAGAVEAAQKADRVVEDESKKPGNDIRVAVNRKGDSMRGEAFKLHDRGEVREAIKVLDEILKKKIYADDQTGMAIGNACRNKRDEWRMELGG